MGKKKAVCFIVFVFLLVMVVAATFSNKQDALNHIQTEKANIEAINWDNLKIVTTSEKTCSIDFESEKVRDCTVSFKATLDNYSYSDMAYLSEDTTLERDISEIKSQAINHIQNYIDTTMKSDVDYIEREMAGLTIKEKKKNSGLNLLGSISVPGSLGAADPTRIPYRR